MPAQSPVPPPLPPSRLPDTWELVWSDEFDSCPNGWPNTSNWKYEVGALRNHELQWYQEDNAYCANGTLVISARQESVEDKDYTSSSLMTRGKHEFQYGRFEMRAKINPYCGSWPAFWISGGVEGVPWPSEGEVDIMEYYQGYTLANFCWGDHDNSPVWNMNVQGVGEAWADEFHTWALEWDAEAMTIFLDGNVMNSQKVSKSTDAGHGNPWGKGRKYFIRINQAIGGDNGGDPADTSFPLDFVVDYVRVYQQKGRAAEQKRTEFVV